MRVFTQEACPECQWPDVKTEHALDDLGHPTHVRDCPACGRVYSLVGYECSVCALIAEVYTLRKRVAELEKACAQVRQWGIELASALPDERERLWIRQWAHINDVLREGKSEKE